MSEIAKYPSLDNKVVIITGGASGIGASIVESFLQQGSKVAFLDKEENLGKNLVETFSNFKHKPLFKHCDLTNIANQSSIEKSLEVDHPTVLINLETGEKVPHWVELDARTDTRGSTIIYIRTLRGLDHNTAYGIGISGLMNITGALISPSLAFQTLIDGQAIEESSA